MLLGLPAIFYQLGKTYGISLTQAKSDFRISLLDWLQANAELKIYAAEKRSIANISLKEQYFFYAERQMAKITAFANASLVVANGLTLVFVLWFAADGVAIRKNESTRCVRFVVIRED